MKAAFVISIVLLSQGLFTQCFIPRALPLNSYVKLTSSGFKSSAFLQPVQLSSQPIEGEDAAAFSLEKQKLMDWGYFGVAVSSVIATIYGAWLFPSGPQLGEGYKSLMESLAGGDSTLTITYMLLFFAVCHSGLASLRPFGASIVGERPWRYVFAFVSLPLSFSAIAYFINHRSTFLISLPCCCIVT
jgi:hypothetical protein